MGFKYFSCSETFSTEPFEKHCADSLRSLSHKVTILQQSIAECADGVKQNSKLVQFKTLKLSIKKLRDEMADNSMYNLELEVRANENKIAILRKGISDEKIRSAQLKKKTEALLDKYNSLESEKILFTDATKKKHNAFLSVNKMFSTLLNCKITLKTDDNCYDLQFQDSKLNATITFKKSQDCLDVVGFEPKLNCETQILEHIRKTEDFQGLISLFHFFFQT